MTATSTDRGKTTDKDAVREHSVWSASATDRNVNCSGAIAVTIDAPETTSEAADWGTCAHQISEACLRSGQDAIEFVGRTVKGKKHEFEVDEEMSDTAQTYIDYVRKRMADYKAETGEDATLFIEEKFSLGALNPPFESGGTSDAVMYFPKWKLLEVVDLKGGRGVVVEVKGNPQARSYGLGAMLAHQKFDIDRVMSTIVQPRANHQDGRTRSETIHTADLVEWTTDLVAAMHRSKEAFDEYELVKSGKTPFAVWAAKWLRAGDHCKFCPAAGFCPALEQRAHDAAGVWFDDLDQPRLSPSNSPDVMSPEKLAATLDSLDMIQEWMNSVRSYAHAQAESGIEIPGYQLVDKIGHRAWTADEVAVATLLMENGVSEMKCYTRKLVSPAQAEKLLGSKKKGAIAEIVERPVRGTNLVAATKTTRPAATPAVHKHFDILD